MIRRISVLVILLFCCLFAFAGSSDINNAFSGYLSQFDKPHADNTVYGKGPSEYLSSYFDAVSDKDSDVISYEDFLKAEENAEINGLSIDDYLDYLFAYIMNSEMPEDNVSEEKTAEVDEIPQSDIADSAALIYTQDDELLSAAQLLDSTAVPVDVSSTKKKRKTKFEVFLLPSLGVEVNEIGTDTVSLGIGGGLGIRALIRMGDHISLSLKGVMTKNLSFVPTLDFKIVNSRIYGGLGFCKNGVVFSVGYLYITKKGWEFGVDLTANNTGSGRFLNSAIIAGFAF